MAGGNQQSVQRKPSATSTQNQRRSTQLRLAFPAGWGGARRNAGRKPKGRPLTPHRARPLHSPAEPVHVTLRARIGPLRSQFLFPTLRLALVRAARRDPEQFRIVHFSVQRDHVHLIVEAKDKRSLSSGMRGLMIRTARYVNDLLGRRGAFWADRWHGRALTSPRAVRNGIVYVLANFRKHGHEGQSRPGRRECRRLQRLAAALTERWTHAPDSGTPMELSFSREGIGDTRPPSAVAVAENRRSRQAVSSVDDAGLDPYSSAGWFDGWRDRRPSPTPAPPNDADPQDFAARTWLLRVGWRKHGLIGTSESPAAVAQRTVNRRRLSWD